MLQPLGIGGSYNVEDLNNITNVAVLYKDYSYTDFFMGNMPQKNYTNYTVGTNGFLFGPNDGLRISALELSTLLMMEMNQGTYGKTKILNPNTIQTMLQPQWVFNRSNGDN